MVRCATKRAKSIFGDSTTIPALNRFYGLVVLPGIVLQEKLPVLLDEGFDDGKLVSS
jgi:hypothetical protein